jgi:hypothetical protein
MPAARFVGAILCLLVLPSLVSAGSGGVGITPDGKKGHLHRVQKGDTLWDITDTYIGTPWIWPSIWQENDEIGNPHLIYPGDLIWIAEGEMRKVTPEEAEALLSRARGDSEAARSFPAAPAGEPDPFAALDVDEVREQRAIRFAGLEHAPFVTAEELDASGAILGSHDEHYWLSQEDTAIIGLGEGQVHAGDRFAIYRVRRRVLHPDTREVIGYFVEVLGKAEVTEIHPESSFAMITHAYAEIEPGDLLTPSWAEPEEFVAKPIDDEVDGTIVAQRPHRSYSGGGDLVVLDQGRDSGIATGHELVVYRAGRLVPDPLSGARIMTPDDVIGRLFVLKSSERTSLALVMTARTEIEPGDRYRAP